MELCEIPRQQPRPGSLLSQSEGRAKRPWKANRSIANIRMNKTLKLKNPHCIRGIGTENTI
jgi:ribosomal protein L28